MEFHSCDALSDKAGIIFKDSLGGLNEWPMEKNWPDGEVSYRLNNFSEDFKKEWQTRAVTVSLRTWQLRLERLNFRREYNRTANVDINISFKPQEVFSSRFTFAHAWYPGQGDISGDCEINDAWNWQPGVHLSDLARPPLIPVLIHEMGHSLGLVHDTTQGAKNRELMYPSYDMGRKQTNLGPNDITRIQERYGARTISQRLLDYFLNRRLNGWDFV